jgi:hypothetical protein
MVTYIKKKIKELSDEVSNFVKKNIIRILVVLGVFIFLEVSKSFPYVNIIPNVDFLIIGFTLLLAVFLLRVTIPNRGIILIVLFSFFMAMVVTIVELNDIADMIGFVIYILLSIMIIRQVSAERKKLKELDLPKK